jgi:hypothetical protein
VALRLGRWLRFPSPLSNRTCGFCRIRLVDWIGEVAAATLEERRDAHEVVVAPGQMRGKARLAPIFRPFDKPRARTEFKATSGPPSSAAPSSIATEPNRAWKRWELRNYAVLWRNRLTETPVLASTHTLERSLVLGCLLLKGARPAECYPLRQNIVQPPKT